MANFFIQDTTDFKRPVKIRRGKDNDFDSFIPEDLGKEKSGFSEEERIEKVLQEVRTIEPERLAPFEDVELDVDTKKLLLRHILRPVQGIVYGADAATAGNYGTFFAAERAYYVIAISENHRVIGSDAGAVTVSVEKCTSGTAPDSGQDLLTTAFSLKATINTPQFGTLTNTKEDLVLRRGDRLVLKDTGVLTAVADVCVTVLLQEI